MFHVKHLPEGVEPRWVTLPNGKLKFEAIPSDDTARLLKHLKEVKANPSRDPMLYSFLRRVGRSRWIVEGKWEKEGL